MPDKEKILHLIQVFDEWLKEASEDQIRQNCREQGAVFFRFLAQRGVHRGWAAKLIQAATSYNAAQLWKVANVVEVRSALNSYYLSMRGVEYEEAERGEQLNWQATQNVVKRFWD